MVSHAESSRHFQLVFETIPGGGDVVAVDTGRPKPGSGGTLTTNGLTRIEVPAGPSYLVLGGEKPHLVTVPPTRLPADSIYLVEPLSRGPDTALLLLAPAAQPIRVNGEHIARVACLKEADVVELGPCGWVCQATLSVRVTIGRPPDAYLGRECPICRTPFVESTSVWLCPSCGTALHAEPDGPGAKRCIDPCSECPSCGAPIVRDPSSPEPPR